MKSLCIEHPPSKNERGALIQISSNLDLEYIGDLKHLLQSTHDGHSVYELSPPII